MRLRFVIVLSGCVSPPSPTTHIATTTARPSVSAHATSTIETQLSLPPGDADDDGMPDDEDYCPTVPGYFPSGCPDDAGRGPDTGGAKNRIVITQSITFEPASIVVAPYYATLLDVIAKFIQANPQVVVRLDGEREGTEDTNVGFERAQAVREELLKRHVNREQLDAGYGNPHARRVEFVVIRQ